MDVTGDRSKVLCNIVKSHESRQIGSGQQEMARVNINILAISELKWTGTGEFNSDDHYIYY